MTTTLRTDPPPDTVCACGHTAEEHDSVASRYCQATAEGAWVALHMRPGIHAAPPMTVWPADYQPITPPTGSRW